MLLNCQSEGGLVGHFIVLNNLISSKKVDHDWRCDHFKHTKTGPLMLAGENIESK